MQGNLGYKIMNEIETLRKVYLNYLGELVPKHGGKMRPRTRYITKWENFVSSPTSRLLIEGFDPRKVWVWSDLHFGHTNIIHYSDRPFINVHQMNEHLVENYNDYVEDDDICIWVGDVAFLQDEIANSYVDRCKGYKILVVGNHDLDSKRKRWKQLNFDEMHLLYLLKVDEFDLLFTHYPIEKGLPKPYINIHGHVHIGKYSFVSPQHYNVCCEFHDYRPLRLDEITNELRLRK